MAETEKTKEHERFTLERRGAVARVKLNRPEEGNTLDAAAMAALGAAVLEQGSDPAIKAVVVTSEGDDFCRGRFVPPGTPRPRNAVELRERVAEPILKLYEDVRRTPVPVIAAVRGEARGLGCAFAVQCDVTIAERGARFSLPEMDKDLPPTLAMSAVMPKMPAKAAMHMVLTRAPFDADTAFTLGMVSEVAAEGKLAQALEGYLEKLVDRDRNALIAVKEYMLAAPDLDVHGAARLGAAMIATVLSSQEK